MPELCFMWYIVHLVIFLCKQSKNTELNSPYLSISQGISSEFSSEQANKPKFNKNFENMLKGRIGNWHATWHVFNKFMCYNQSCS